MRVRRRNFLAIFLQPFKVKLDGFPNHGQRLLASFTNGHTARKIRDIGASALGTKNDDILHKFHLFFQASLFQHIVECARRHVNVKLKLFEVALT
jgi:hypothetical protein